MTSRSAPLGGTSKRGIACTVVPHALRRRRARCGAERLISARSTCAEGEARALMKLDWVSDGPQNRASRSSPRARYSWCRRCTISCSRISLGGPSGSHNVENDGVEYLEFNIRFGHSPLKMRLMLWSSGVLLPFSVHARVKDFLHGLLVRWCAR